MMGRTSGWSPGSHDGVDRAGHWYQHLYPVEDEQCWCGWKPPKPITGTLQAAFVEGADVGYLILALLERIHRLEEAQLGQRQGE